MPLGLATRAEPSENQERKQEQWQQWQKSFEPDPGAGRGLHGAALGQAVILPAIPPDIQQHSSSSSRASAKAAADRSVAGVTAVRGAAVATGGFGAGGDGKAPDGHAPDTLSRDKEAAAAALLAAELTSGLPLIQASGHKQGLMKQQQGPEVAAGAGRKAEVAVAAMSPAGLEVAPAATAGTSLGSATAREVGIAGVGGQCRVAGQAMAPEAAASLPLGVDDVVLLTCLKQPLALPNGERFKLQVLGYLGSGGCATIWCVKKSRYQPPPIGIRSLTPDIMALKVTLRYCDLTCKQRERLSEAVLVRTNESMMLLEHDVMGRCFGCDHVLQTYGFGLLSCPGGEKLHCVLTEYCSLGSLERQLVVDGAVRGMDAATARMYVRQAAAGLEKVHSSGRAMHRDLKACNLLLSGEQLEGAKVLVADFGTARLCDGADDSIRKTHLVGTLPYMAPEVLQKGGTHDARVDVWQLGLVLLELRAGRVPFWYLKLECITEEEADARRCPEELDNPSSPYCELLSGEEKAFVKRCLVVDYRYRPSLKTLCADDPYLQQP